MGKLFFSDVVVRLPACIPGRRHILIGAVMLVVGVTLPHMAQCQSETPQHRSIDSDTATAQIQALDSFAAEQERLKKLLADKPPAYQDKVMEPGAQLLGEEPVDADEEEPEGFRSWSVESRTGFADYASDGQERQGVSDAGIRAEYRQETQNYGEFSLQADVRSRVRGDVDASIGSQLSAREKDAARITLRNFGLPLTTSTTADTSVGDIGSEVTDAFTRSPRVSLGSSQVRGAGVRVTDGKFDLRAGTGQRGNLGGGPFAGFEKEQGNVSWLGYSQRFDNGLIAGVQASKATAIPALEHKAALAGTDASEDVDSVAVSLGYGGRLENDGDKKARITAITSHVVSSEAGEGGRAGGVFVEGGVRSGRYQHEMGVYDSGPDVRFGDNRLASNTRGAYWRTDRSGSRLSVGGGVDIEQYKNGDDVVGAASLRSGGSINAQYQIDRNRSIGGNLSISDTRRESADGAGASGQHSLSSNANVYYQTRLGSLGPTRFSAILRRNEALVANAEAATGDELQWEQDWITGKYETMRPELGTTLGLAHDRSGNETQTYPTAGINTRYWLDSDWSVAGNLRYTSRKGNLSTSQGLSGSASTEYALNGGWKTGLQANINQARVNVAGNSLQEPLVSRSHDKSAQFYLRWEEASGSPFQLVGKKNVGLAGSGSIKGAVFFDANRDGEQQAGEANVPEVEVFLDGRYRTTTGRDGRFEFAQVTTGEHDLTLNLDTVPLPWGSARDQSVSVKVPLRDWIDARIPVVKATE